MYDVVATKARYPLWRPVLQRTALPPIRATELSPRRTIQRC